LIGLPVRRKLFGFFLSLHRGQKFWVEKIVSLYSIFFRQTVCRCRFNRYIFEYRCPPLAAPFSSEYSLKSCVCANSNLQTHEISADYSVYDLSSLRSVYLVHAERRLKIQDRLKRIVSRSSPGIRLLVSKTKIPKKSISMLERWFCLEKLTLSFPCTLCKRPETFSLYCTKYIYAQAHSFRIFSMRKDSFCVCAEHKTAPSIFSFLC